MELVPRLTGNPCPPLRLGGLPGNREAVNCDGLLDVDPGPPGGTDAEGPGATGSRIAIAFTLWRAA